MDWKILMADLGECQLKPIVLLENNGFYVPAIKLGYSLIDSLAFAYYKESNSDAFKKWVSRFMRPSRIGITRDQIWENRNALLHVSTSTSFKTKRGKIREIDFNHNSYKLWNGVIEINSPHTLMSNQRYLDWLIEGIKYFFSRLKQAPFPRQYNTMVHLIQMY